MKHCAQRRRTYIQDLAPLLTNIPCPSKLMSLNFNIKCRQHLIMVTKNENEIN